MKQRGDADQLRQRAKFGYTLRTSCDWLKLGAVDQLGEKPRSATFASLSRRRLPPPSYMLQFLSL
jgi:hypothetical protein